MKDMFNQWLEELLGCPDKQVEYRVHSVMTMCLELGKTSDPKFTAMFYRTLSKYREQKYTESFTALGNMYALLVHSKYGSWENGLDTSVMFGKHVLTITQDLQAGSVVNIHMKTNVVQQELER